MPSISVIVPVYKVEPYLRQCVDSILGQTFRDFELILVDDGSPDSCGAICEEYAEKYPFIHVIHRENGGLSAARNSGIDWAFANSDSQWLAFADSDDWVAPEYLEMLCRAVQDTGCRLSACGLERTAGEDLPENQEYQVEVLSPDDYYCGEIVQQGTVAVAWNKLYSKELFAQLRYPNGKIHEDEFTTYKIVYQLDSVAWVPARLYAYFQNAQGITGVKWSPKRMHSLEAMEQQIAYARQRNMPRFLKNAAESYVYNLCRQIPQAEKAYHRELRKKLRAGLRLARKCGLFPFGWEMFWAYEMAYPVKPVWWLLFKLKAKLGR